MKNWIYLCLWVFCSAWALHGQAKLSPKELKPTVGAWAGTLTYLDYTSGKSFSMPAALTVSRTRDRNQFQCQHAFPEESEANWTDTLSITAKGAVLDGEVVQTKQFRSDGNLVIVTEGDGLDGNDQRPARFRHTYTIGKTVFLTRKEVKFVGEDSWILRNEYAYQRLPAPSPSSK